MKKIQITYDYIFYVIYRFWEKAPSRWWSDWKTVITICFLIGFAISASINTTIYVLEIDLVPKTKILPIIISLIIFGLNYNYFLYKDKWRERILRFESLNKKSNGVGVTLIVIMVGIIICSLIFSYYLLSIVDWKNIQ